MHILVLSYSQTGDVNRAAEAFVEPLQAAGATVVWEHLRPRVPYPSPWRSMRTFFGVMPDCMLGHAPEIEDPRFDAGAPFDLVILAYQVWFLSPSLPIRRFLESRHAEVLRGRKVVTLSVSRNMWHSASLTMKQLLAAAGGQQIDNIASPTRAPLGPHLSPRRAPCCRENGTGCGRIFPPAGLDPNNSIGWPVGHVHAARQLPSLATRGNNRRCCAARGPSS